MTAKCFHLALFRCVFAPVQRRTLFLSSAYRKDSKDDASSKLQNLLQSIIKDDSLEKEKKLEPIQTSSVVPKKKPPQEKIKDLGKKIVESAEDVSKSLPGKPEQTEAQLLHKLLYKDKTLTENILKATAGKELLQELLSKMSVEQPKKPKSQQRVQYKEAEFSRATKVRDILGRREFIPYKQSDVPFEKVDFDSQGKLGIFRGGVEEEAASRKAGEVEEPSRLEVWEAMRQRDLKLLTSHPPRNIYEQMIIWTEKGILWKFPIDNEIGLEEEENTDFTEHVFLEVHLEDWCPAQGPIRHFMELVCVGLSRNHWLSAKEKKAHILWYKDFFEQKSDLVRELGAGDIKKIKQTATSAQISE